MWRSPAPPPVPRAMQRPFSRHTRPGEGDRHVEDRATGLADRCGCCRRRRCRRLCLARRRRRERRGGDADSRQGADRRPVCPGRPHRQDPDRERPAREICRGQFRVQQLPGCLSDDLADHFGCAGGHGAGGVAHPAGVHNRRSGTRYRGTPEDLSQSLRRPVPDADRQRRRGSPGPPRPTRSATAA